MAKRLDEEESTLLGLVLDETIERWQIDLPETIRAIARDKTVTDLDDMMQLSGDQAAMIEVLKRIRKKVGVL